MPRSASAVLATTLLLTAGCLDVGPTTNTLPFDFTIDGIADNWIVGVADVPVARVAEVAVVGDERALPASISTTLKSLYQSGTNVSGDLFVFQKKYIPGLHALADYKVSAQIHFVSDIQSGCTTGAGPAVVIKAGMTDVEPLAVADAQGVLRMNIDKGAGTARGEYTQLGDIRNELTGCPATGTFAGRITALLQQTKIVHTDATGGFWIFMGTQSSFAGRHELYIVGLRLEIELQ